MSSCQNLKLASTTRPTSYHSSIHY